MHFQHASAKLATLFQLLTSVRKLLTNNLLLIAKLVNNPIKLACNYHPQNAWDGK